MRTHECSTVSCNCGVAAREGNDVIVIDFCNEKFQTARFASKGSPANGTKFMRDRTGKHFMVSMNSAIQKTGVQRLLVRLCVILFSLRKFSITSKLAFCKSVLSWNTFLLLFFGSPIFEVCQFLKLSVTTKRLYISCKERNFQSFP